VKPLHHRRSRPRALTPEAVETVRLELPTMRDVVLWDLLCYAGLRPIEALALTWESVGDLLVIDGAKHGPRRTIPIIPALREDLDGYRPRVTAPGELVVPNRFGQALDLDNWRFKRLQPALERAGVRATPYDGRHTFASLLLHEGWTLGQVAAVMGHSSSTTTARYYEHIYEAAQLRPRVPMAEAVEAARATLAAERLPKSCPSGDVRVLRAVLPTAKSA
jgi:integrase